MSKIESPNLDVRHLRMLVAVADLGTLTAAAAALHLTQSALSHQLRDAEERVGTCLFRRQDGRMVSTSAASALIQTARKLLAELKQAEGSVSPAQSPDSGVLRVSTNCLAWYQSWSEYALEFRERCPDVEIQINTEASGRLLDALLNGQIDLALINGSAPLHNELSSHLVVRDEMMAVFARRHPLVHKDFIEIKDFSNQEVLVYPPQTKSFLLCNLLAPRKVNVRRVFEVPFTEEMVRVASLTDAVAFLPRWAFLPYAKCYPVEMRPVTRAGIYREWNAVMLKQPKPPAYFSKFIELMTSRLAAALCNSARPLPKPKSAVVRNPLRLESPDSAL